MSDTLRITGLASGLDVDGIVKQLMKAENIRLDKLKQERQLTEWRQELYRDLIGDLNLFKSTYFDVLKSDTYMLSSKNYSSFDVKSSDNTNAVTASTVAGAAAGSYKISVAHLAEKAEFTGSVYVNTAEAPNSVTFPINIVQGKNDKLTIQGSTGNIDITLTARTYKNMSELMSEINSKLASTPDGSGKLSDSIGTVLKDDKIYLLKKVTISDNTNLTLKLSSDYNATIKTGGNYTLAQIASQINSQISSIKDADGNKLPDGTKAELSSDGTSIEIKDKDGTVLGYVYNGAGKLTSSTALVSSTGSTDASVSDPIVSGGILSYSKEILSGVNDKLTIKIGSATTINVTLSNNAIYSDPASTQSEILQALADDIHSQLPDTSTFDVVADTVNNRIKFVSKTNEQVIISGSAAGTIGLPSYYEAGMSSYDKMSNIVSGPVEFTVNGQTFRYDFDSDTDSGTGDTAVVGAKNMSISDIMSDISSKANVSITYSQLTRQFTLTSKDTGEAQVIVDTKDVSGNFLQTILGQSQISDASGYMSDGTTKLQGQNAVVTITEPNSTGITISKPTNSFTVDGVNYTLNNQPEGEVTFTLTANANNTYDKIKAFIDKYNEIIDKINDKLSEKRDYDYMPLTDDQKEEMEEDQITKWEEKAKQGLLRGESALENMLSDMRKAFYEKVEGAGIYLTDIGLSTSSDTLERGKIVIDETKLKEAIQNNPDRVADLFMKSSDIPYSVDGKSEGRYKEEGIFQRINDILQDNLRTLRDSNGNKGILLEKAGIKGDFSEYNNLLTEELDRQDKKIDELIDKLIDKENRYYLQFSRLESAMSQLNAQSNWLTSQLGMSN